MADLHFDVCVIGGGINGAGAAQAAAAAGHSTVLLEKSSLAAGTSSKSSKLIHGGLRYLESYEFSLVHESLTERALLLRNAPDLVRLVPFHIPVYEHMRRPAWMVRSGLTLYALLGHLRTTARFKSIPRTQWATLDGLATAGLKAVFCYQDAQTDDALLTRAVMHSACALGAETRIPARVTQINIGAQSAQVCYHGDGGDAEITAQVVVNAAGPWVNRVLETVSPKQKILGLDLVQGTHVEVSGSPRHGIYYVEAKRDGRAVFVMPWRDHTLVGTTETRFRGDPDNAVPLSSEISYLRRILHNRFPDFAGGELLTAWAGLRVLPSGAGHAFHKSRETVFHPDRQERPVLVSIYGGKLTAFRATAERLMAILAPSLSERKRRASTKTLRLSPP